MYPKRIWACRRGACAKRLPIVWTAPVEGARSKALKSRQPRVKLSAEEGQIARSHSEEVQGQIPSAERGPTLGRRQ